jgi:3',5'-cyclic AMP phosphodiesterase CpdA
VLPGEHDASLDGGRAFADAFGDTRWAFEHGGVHFVGVDNASDPKGGLGAAQLAWLSARVDEAGSAPLVVFAHRPLFPLAPAWDWHTPDGDQALAILARHPRATVFYGHIHQASLVKTGTTTHVSTRALVFPLPAPMSVPEKKPLPWDPAAADHGLGYRGIVLAYGNALWIERALA